MFLGLRTVIYHAPDLARAKAWYVEAFGVKPYFDEPFYVGFDVGGYELGLNPDTSHVSIGNNAVAYWGVRNIEEAYARMLSHGARPPARRFMRLATGSRWRASPIRSAT